jgi:hypothetical protein
MKTKCSTALKGSLALLICGLATPVLADLKTHFVDGIKPMKIGTDEKAFSLTAKDGYIMAPDGSSIYVWGFAPTNGAMQYPGPTLILGVGNKIVIHLTNNLPVPVSMVFPGQANVVASNGTPGLLTLEAPPGGYVRYAFTATQPGTYMYHSGTQPDLQIEMGLVGAIIVQPAIKTQAYDHPNTAFDHEYLMLITELDPVIHEAVERADFAAVDTARFFPVYWFINGRTAPDTLAPAFVGWLPNQPYDALYRMHPGQKILFRVIGAGRDFHPLHHHGMNSRTIARDGRLLESTPGAGPDLADSDFTIKCIPGGTADALYEWTGEKLGWDVYGHQAGDPLEPNEYAPDHGKPFPVKLPHIQDVFLGDVWSGSPFLGQAGLTPPSHVLFNPAGAYFHMFHSHADKELTAFDVFPSGIMTFIMIEKRTP